MKQSIPQLYSKNPFIFFKPTSPGAENAAEVFELLVNQKWPQRKMKQTMRDGIKTCKLFGVCGFKTFYYFKDKNEVQREWDDRIENDDVRTDRVPLKELLKDPDSTWKNSPWIAHEIRAIKDDIVKQFKIKNPQEVTVVQSTAKSAEMNVPDDVRSDFQYGRYWEIEDRRNGETLVIVDGVERILNKKKKDYPFETMYDFLEYNDIPDRPYTLSDYKFWRSQLIELALYRSMVLNHARKGTAKYKAVGPKLEEGQLSQLKTSADSSVVQLNNGQDVVPFQHANIDPNVLNAMGLVQSDIQLISKQAPRQNVGSDKTATEVKAVEFAAREVSSEQLEALEEVMGSIAQKWAQLMHANYNTTRVVALTEMTEAEFMGFQESLGEETIQGDPKAPFLMVNKNTLNEKVKAGVKAGSTAPDSQASRAQKFQGFAQFVSQSPQLMAGVDVEEMLKEATEVFDVRNENLTKDKDNPMEESRLLNANAFVAPKISEDHAQHIAIHERETNGSEANVIHILAHKMFQAQLEAIQGPGLQGGGPGQPGIDSGQSFQALVNQLQGQAPQEAPAQAAQPLGQAVEGGS
jgi:hypothetical protein